MRNYPSYWLRSRGATLPLLTLLASENSDYRSWWIRFAVNPRACCSRGQESRGAAVLNWVTGRFPVSAKTGHLSRAGRENQRIGRF